MTGADSVGRCRRSSAHVHLTPLYLCDDLADLGEPREIGGAVAHHLIDVIGTANLPRWQHMVIDVNLIATSTVGRPSAAASRRIVSEVWLAASPLESSTSPICIQRSRTCCTCVSASASGSTAHSLPPVGGRHEADRAPHGAGSPVGGVKRVTAAS